MSSHPIVGDGPFTVGELLADAERTARRLLGRPITADGTSLLAGWDVVLAAASEVLAAQTTASATPAGGDAVGLVSGLVTKLVEEARAVEVAQVPSRLHPDIVRVTLTWRQAAAASEQSPTSHRDTPDLVALRTMRTLAVVAHATQLALGGNGPGVAGLDAGRGAGVPPAAAAARAAGVAIAARPDRRRLPTHSDGISQRLSHPAGERRAGQL